MSMEAEQTFTRFEKMAEKYPNRPAIIYLGEKFTYARLRNLIDRLCTALNHLGGRQGSRVMICLPTAV